MVVSHTWPVEWHKFTNTVFTLTSNVIRTRSTYSPRQNTNLSYQVWMAEFTYKEEVGPSLFQQKEAFFSRLDGETNPFRIGDPLRCFPAMNRQKMGLVNEPWSDDTYFTDGTGWSDGGLMPPHAFVLEAAVKGARFLKIGGLPAGVVGAFTPGDLFELQINGVPTETSNLYSAVIFGNTNSNGETGIEIRPGLRQNFGVGDRVVLFHPKALIQLADSNGGVITRRSNIGALGFSGIEYVG